MQILCAAAHERYYHLILTLPRPLPRLVVAHGDALYSPLMLVLTASAAQADVITHVGTTINMDFVTVGNAGNAGNAADDTGFGAVDYNYRIGKYEVTAAQWAKVIEADPDVGNKRDWNGSQPTAGTSWYEAAKFCHWLTTGSANSGVYTVNDSGVVTGIWLWWIEEPEPT